MHSLAKSTKRIIQKNCLSSEKITPNVKPTQNEKSNSFFNFQRLKFELKITKICNFKLQSLLIQR